MTLCETESGQTTTEPQPLQSRDIQEIWETLLSGEKIEIKFFTRKDVDRFRVRLHQVKAISEKKLISIGFMEESEIQSLIFDLKSKPVLYKDGEIVPLLEGETLEQAKESLLGKLGNNNYYIYHISLGKRLRETVKYAIKIVS